MKKLLCVVLVLLMMGSALAEGASSDIDWSAMTDSDIMGNIDLLYKWIRDAKAELESRGETTTYAYQTPDTYFNVTVFRTQSSWKDDEILVQYDWMNRGSKAASFASSIATKAYQNGRELDKGVLPSYSMGGEWDNILPGTKATNYMCFKLMDASDVTIMVSDTFSAGNPERSLTIPVRLEYLDEYK